MQNNCNSKNATKRTRMIKNWAERDNIRSSIFSNEPTHSTPRDIKIRRNKLLELLQCIKNLPQSERLPSDKAKDLIDQINELRI